MANDPNSSQRMPGVGERIRRLAENPVPAGGVADDVEYAHAGGFDDHHWHDDGHHPTAKTYFIVGAFLTAITAVEVWVYYIPSFVASPAFVPSLLIMSAVKFATVVMVYMHLKYDHKLFRALFTGPFLIAFVTLFALMFLFGKLAIRLGILS